MLPISPGYYGIEVFPREIKKILMQNLGRTKQGGQCEYGELRFWSINERRTFGNLLQQDWFRSPPRYDHRDGVGRPKKRIKGK